MTGKEPNSRLIRNRLIEEMRSGRYSGLAKLPPEDVLAEEMQISRTQLRDSLSQLESEGYVSRRRGLGTLINRHVLALGIRADIETEFRKIIAAMGMAPGIDFTNIREAFSDEAISGRLDIRPGSPVYRIERMVTADGRRVIFCEDYLPHQHIKRFDYTEADLAQPIFDFLEQFCDEQVYMDITRMKPVVADEALARLLCVKEGSPLMHLEEVAYSFEGLPLIFSSEYYTADMAEHTLLRRWQL